jgi:hypothetical protein
VAALLWKGATVARRSEKWNYKPPKIFGTDTDEAPKWLFLTPYASISGIRSGRDPAVVKPGVLKPIAITWIFGIRGADLFCTLFLLLLPLLIPLPSIFEQKSLLLHRSELAVLRRFER